MFLRSLETQTSVLVRGKAALVSTPPPPHTITPTNRNKCPRRRKHTTEDLSLLQQNPISCHRPDVVDPTATAKTPSPRTSRTISSCTPRHKRPLAKRNHSCRRPTPIARSPKEKPKKEEDVVGIVTGSHTLPPPPCLLFTVHFGTGPTQLLTTTSSPPLTLRGRLRETFRLAVS